MAHGTFPVPEGQPRTSTPVGLLPHQAGWQHLGDPPPTLPAPSSTAPQGQGMHREQRGMREHRGQHLSTHLQTSRSQGGSQGGWQGWAQEWGSFVGSQHHPLTQQCLWEGLCTHRPLAAPLTEEGRLMTPARQGHPRKARSLHFGGQSPRVGHSPEGVVALPGRARLSRRALYINERGWEWAGPTPARCPMACGALLPEHAIGRI